MIQCSWNQPQGIKLGRSHFRSQSYFSTIYSKVILESNVSVLLSQDQCLDQKLNKSGTFSLVLFQNIANRNKDRMGGTRYPVTAWM